MKTTNGLEWKQKEDYYMIVQLQGN